MTSTTRKRLTREESRAQTRTGLLHAARLRFAQHGYEGTATEQVAEDAGYSRGALHYNFKNKDDLFVEVMRDCFAEDRRGLDALIAQHDGHPVEVAVASFRASAQDPSAYLLRLEFWMRALRDEHFRQKYLSEHRQFREALVQRSHEHLRPDTAAEYVALVMGLHNGLELIHLLDPAVVTTDTYQRTLEEVLPAYRLTQ